MNHKAMLMLRSSVLGALELDRETGCAFVRCNSNRRSLLRDAFDIRACDGISNRING